MTINSLFNGVMSNLVLGGVAAFILLAAMFLKANRVAASGNTAKMASWSLAPSMMVIAAVLAHSVAAAIVIPRLQAMFQSAPMQNTLAMGDALTTAADSLLFGNYSGEGGAYVGADVFKAPLMEASNSAPLVNDGATASFADRPAPVSANAEVRIMSNEQAVAAINALAATATPVGGGQAYINQFIADNKPVDTTIACNGSYTVKGGDSLAKIAKACFGDSSKWTLICKANPGIGDCNNIRSGMVLAIPAAGSAALASNNQVVNSQPTAIPAWGQQSVSYTKPVQTQQQAETTARNIDSSQVVITSNADAVAAIQNMAPAPTPTPRAAYVLSEVLNQPQSGGGMDYINKFLAENNNNQMADADN